MIQTFKLRWDERDRLLQQEFVKVRQNMNARGILNSSITIQNAHGVIVAEFRENRLLITKTVLDHVRSNKKLAKTSDFNEYAQQQLAQRKDRLERSLRGAFSAILDGLQNKAMIAPFLTLDADFDLAKEELKVELNEAIDNYNSTFGSNLTEQLRNQFLNHPILAVIVLSAAGAGFILGLLSMLGVLSVGDGS